MFGFVFIFACAPMILRACMHGQVFHKYCVWPASYSAESSEHWLCPRHNCTSCSAVETLDKPASKCSQCTISFCTACLPGGLPSAKCHHCSNPTPRAELATVLQKVWCKVANHYLAEPFMRPLLSLGAAPAAGGGVDDLVGILERIRSLEYVSAERFVQDLDLMRTKVEAISSSAPALPMACSTLLLLAEQALSKHRTRIVGLEGLLRTCSAEEAVLTEMGGCVVGLEGHTPGAHFPDATPHRSMAEWQEFVTNPPPPPPPGVCILSLPPSSSRPFFACAEVFRRFLLPPGFCGPRACDCRRIAPTGMYGSGHSVFLAVFHVHVSHVARLCVFNAGHDCNPTLRTLGVVDCGDAAVSAGPSRRPNRPGPDGRLRRP